MVQVTTANEAQAEAAAAQVAQVLNVDGSMGTFDQVVGKEVGLRRANLINKLGVVVKGMKQSELDNKLGIERLEKELAGKKDKLDYLAKKEAELKELVDGGTIASVTDLNNFMGKEENKRLATTVGY
jgi:hypothetical protein